MSLYSCLSGAIEGQYTISKFSNDGDYQSAYTVSEDTYTCTCPAAQRESCRHREMLQTFIEEDHIGDGWMYDFDNDQWIEANNVE